MLSLFYRWPDGLVWGNVAAEPLIAVPAAAAAWLLRHRLMARFVAFHHHHKVLHAERLERDSNG